MTVPKDSLFQPSSLHVLLALGLAVLLGGGLLLYAAPDSEPAADDPPTLIKHLRTELQSRDPVRRDHALVDIVSLGRCSGSCSVSLASVRDKQLSIQNETEVGTVLDLDALIPDLITVYRTGPARGHRLLALSALINIGNQEALARLADEAPSQSADVERATNRTLAAFYLEKYPELMKQARRTKTLTVQDIQRAERIRLSVARRQARGGSN